MRELGQLHAVLLAQQSLVVPALPDIVDLNRFIALGGHTQLARIIKVDREDVWCFAILGIVSLKELFKLSQPRVVG